MAHLDCTASWWPIWAKVLPFHRQIPRTLIHVHHAFTLRMVPPGLSLPLSKLYCFLILIPLQRLLETGDHLIACKFLRLFALVYFSRKKKDWVLTENRKVNIKSHPLKLQNYFKPLVVQFASTSPSHRYTHICIHAHTPYAPLQNPHILSLIVVCDKYFSDPRGVLRTKLGMFMEQLKIYPRETIFSGKDCL